MGGNIIFYLNLTWGGKVGITLLKKEKEVFYKSNKFVF